MRRDLTRSLIAVVLFTALLGIAYPLIVTGFAQVAFHGRANGSLIHRDGKVVGSSLQAQAFTKADGKTPDARYFQPRPSQTDYNGAVTAFSNRGPNQKSARTFYASQLRAYLARERRYDPQLTQARVPVDAVTTSASGVDPHISVANARIQARRIAAVRHLPLRDVLALVEAHTDGRALGVLGEPGVNVLELNLALGHQAS